MQQRYYDPQIGVFTSVDPVGVDPAGGNNFSRYWYAADNPYAFYDPDGRVAKTKPADGTGGGDLPPPREDPNRPKGCGTARFCWRDGSGTWHVTPVPLYLYAQNRFNAGVVAGAWSFVRGNGRFIRQTARGEGWLGQSEKDQVALESAVMGALGTELENNPKAREMAYQAIVKKLNRIDFADPYVQGYIAGRLGAGIYFRPLGFTAAWGDLLQAVEDGVRDPSELIWRGTAGGH